mmetsp:Transcript_1866/g.3995  ORF Transcript_1866/g.3995 Transcript_1866/m.3995 type:complete len:322 (+) Transcript_1866:2153-3118(+)
MGRLDMVCQSLLVQRLLLDVDFRAIPVALEHHCADDRSSDSEVASNWMLHTKSYPFVVTQISSVALHVQSISVNRPIPRDVQGNTYFKLLLQPLWRAHHIFHGVAHFQFDGSRPHSYPWRLRDRPSVQYPAEPDHCEEERVRHSCQDKDQQGVFCRVWCDNRTPCDLGAWQLRASVAVCVCGKLHDSKRCMDEAGTIGTMAVSHQSDFLVLPGWPHGGCLCGGGCDHHVLYTFSRFSYHPVDAASGTYRRCNWCAYSGTYGGRYGVGFRVVDDTAFGCFLVDPTYILLVCGSGKAPHRWICPQWARETQPNLEELALCGPH